MAKKVCSVTDFVEKLRTLTESSLGQFIFRGQGNSKWGLECGASRRIKKTRRTVHSEDFSEYHQNLINSAKLRNFQYRDDHILSDLELIAELEHYGTATCLLDFTKTPLISLWFACSSELDLKSGQESDGAVVLLDISDIAKFNKIMHEDIKKEATTFFYNEKYWFWEPAHLNNRILRQHSVFVFGKPEIDFDLKNKIIVDGTSKEAILKELKTLHDISEESLFYDLPGFADANRYKKELKLPTAQELLGMASLNYFAKEYVQAEKHCLRAIKLIEKEGNNDLLSQFQNYWLFAC